MNKKSIVGNLYYPKDNSYIGIYDSEGNLSEGGQLVSRGDKPMETTYLAQFTKQCLQNVL